jgi:cell wall-associated NlpC family hydrolase
VTGIILIKRLSLPASILNNGMKDQFILLLLLINLSACNVFRPASRNTDNLSNRPVSESGGKGQSVEFIQGISTESGNSADPVSMTGNTTSKNRTRNTSLPEAGNELYSPLQFKYAILTNSPVEELTNQRLLAFMDQWYGVPYHYGGTNMGGIDCSAFTCQLISNVYDVNQLPRMSADQYKATRRISKKDLREGDLVFFHTIGKGKRVTHVGVYLYNNRFVHASIAGVQISDLGEGYYLQHYVGAGRIVQSDKTF